jgi:hypothetical protein
VNNRFETETDSYGGLFHTLELTGGSLILADGTAVGSFFFFLGLCCALRILAAHVNHRLFIREVPTAPLLLVKTCAFQHPARTAC